MVDTSLRKTKRKRSVSRRGQSMLEAIISIGIIVTSVAASLTLVQGAISAEKESEAGIIATNLAREGIEVVRALRDSNWLAGIAWDQGFSGTGSDYTSILVFTPSTNTWALSFVTDLITDGSASVYRYPAGTGSATEGLHVQAQSQPTNTDRTDFSRLITTNPICDDGSPTYSIITSGSSCATMEKIGVQVISRVAWTAAGDRARDVTVEELMFNWR